MTPIRPLPGNSAPFNVINTAATRGRNEYHSRGERGAVHKDTSPFKKNSRKKTRRSKPSGSRSQVLPLANHGTKLGLFFGIFFPRHFWTILSKSGKSLPFFLEVGQGLLLHFGSVGSISSISGEIGHLPLNFLKLDNYW